MYMADIVNPFAASMHAITCSDKDGWPIAAG